MPDLHTGSIKWYNDAKGFGFITSDDDKEVFMHHQDLIPLGSRDFHEGTRVSFTVERGIKGLQARTITKIWG